MIYYHASDVEGIRVLKTGESSLVYFSTKRENVLVYLSNAIKRYCLETGVPYRNECKWGPYGFTHDGRILIEEYYPDALVRTYSGEKGYIYMAEDVADSGDCSHIRDVVTSRTPVPVSGVEVVEDAYLAILQAERDGLLAIRRYDEMTERHREWLANTIRQQYLATDKPEYKHFLLGHFQDLLEAPTHTGAHDGKVKSDET